MTRISPAGLAVGLIFMAGSLVPALLPRPWYVQGVLSGIALALGYAVGAGVAAGWRRIWNKREPSSDSRRPVISYLALAVALATLAWALVIHVRWQLDVRMLMEMAPGVWAYLPPALLVAVVTGALLVIGGRGVLASSRHFLRLLQRVMPRGLAVVVEVIAVVLILVLLFDLVVASRLVPALEEAHHRSDQSFDSDVEVPTSSLRSGGPGSLIEWERMGRQGREFVAGAPAVSDLEGFSGEPANDPIRIYVGLEVADSAQSRALLALEEMERMGAFDREVIVLVAPTGSGWIDPYAIEPVEYMYNGDTAAVAVQYSYLASWLVMIRNQDLATDASRALYQAVRQRLEEEPEASRPKLLLYGESLGAFGWERTFDDLAEAAAAADGILWVGPPRVNPLWREMVASRDSGSLLWRPVFDEGKTVRFGPDLESLLAPGGTWPPPRIVYLQHASDPITWLGLDVITERPAWLDPPRGPDVSRHTPYLPVVTYVQMAVDLALGTSAPVGHGHKFGPAQAEAWSLILPPSDWDNRDTDALLAHIGG